MRNPAKRRLRVGQWTTGNVAKQAVRAVLARPDLEVVGAYARSAEKVGADVGTLCGLEEIGVRATGDVDELLGLDLDCMIYAPLHFDVAEVVRLLRGGVNVVTSAEFLTGRNLAKADREALLQAAADGGATLFGSGINPGFIEMLAGVAAGMSMGVEKVSITEAADVGSFVSDANFQGVGWGRPRDDPGHAADVRAATAVFAEAVEVLAALLDVVLDDVRCDVAFAHATEDIELPGANIRKGHVAGMDVIWRGVAGGRDVIVLTQRWLATNRVEPAWTVGHMYRIEVAGDPHLTLELDVMPTAEDLADLSIETMRGIGMRITAMPVVNAIPAVCAAAPGIATYADLPLITTRLVPNT